MAHVYDDAIRGCTASGTCDFVGNLFSGYGAIVDTVHLTIALPVVLGGLATVVVARESEQATNVLVWTQSVTRRRWILSKVAALLGATLVVSAAAAALVTWWSGTPNALDGNRFQGAEFDTQNIAPIAYALFAVALGLAMAALWRRALPALAATVGIYVAIRLLVGVYVRPHYMKAVTKTAAFSAGLPSGSWTINRGIVDAAGKSLDKVRLQAPSSCVPTDDVSARKCLSQLGYHEFVKFQPASRYWHFQLAEAGLFLVLAAALVSVAIVYTLRRDA